MFFFLSFCSKTFSLVWAAVLVALVVVCPHRWTLARPSRTHWLVDWPQRLQPPLRPLLPLRALVATTLRPPPRDWTCRPPTHQWSEHCPPHSTMTTHFHRPLPPPQRLQTSSTWRRSSVAIMVGASFLFCLFSLFGWCFGLGGFHCLNHHLWSVGCSAFSAALLREVRLLSYPPLMSGSLDKLCQIEEVDCLFSSVLGQEIRLCL